MRSRYKLSMHKKVMFTMIATIILFAGAWLLEGFEETQTVIERKDYGGGVRTEELIAVIDGLKKGITVQIEIDELKYKKDEINEIISQKAAELDKLILGNNKKLDHIDSDLNLVKKIPGTSIVVEWSFDRHDLIDLNGRLLAEGLSDQGELLELRAMLKYEGIEVMYMINAVLYSPKKSLEDELRGKIEKTIKEANNKTKEIKKFVLPDRIHGKKVLWKKERGSMKFGILVLGIAVMLYWVLAKRQEEEKKRKERKNQMLIDYPEIVNKFVILLGAGMTVKGTWKTIVDNYEMRDREKVRRYAYEEMCQTYRELQSQVGEAQCYEHFGKSCQITEYIKFGALLSQNLRKGNSGLIQILAREADNAFEERKSRARKIGEEAGTKLLLPMFLMLSIVLIVIVVPAFLSIQM